MRLATLILCGLLSSGVITTPLLADTKVVSLNDAVAMVQQRFNATAIKTDTVHEGDQVRYRIRLLSADKTRVWTVTVDAHTGQVQ